MQRAKRNACKELKVPLHLAAARGSNIPSLRVFDLIKSGEKLIFHINYFPILWLFGNRIILIFFKFAGSVITVIL